MAIGDGDRVRERRPRRRSLIGRGWKRIGKSRRVRRAAGSAIAGYIRLVGATNKLIYEGEVDYASYDFTEPVIVTVWHGQHILLPAVRRKDHQIVALVSRHRDGDLNAIVVEKLGVETVRGSAARDRDKVVERGGISGFLKLRNALKDGKTALMTADLSNTVARRAGLGVIKLARATGVPIAPLALATSRRVAIGSSWDRTSLNLPFGRLAMVSGKFQHVPTDADDGSLESYRLALETELNRITDRAYAIVDRRDG